MTSRTNRGDSDGLAVGSLVSPLDPASQLTTWPIAFACCLPVAYWLVRWPFDAAEGVRQSLTRE